MGVPPNHHLDRTFHYQPSVLGIHQFKENSILSVVWKNYGNGGPISQTLIALQCAEGLHGEVGKAIGSFTHHGPGDEKRHTKKVLV